MRQHWISLNIHVPYALLYHTSSSSATPNTIFFTSRLCLGYSGARVYSFSGGALVLISYGRTVLALRVGAIKALTQVLSG